MSPTTTKARSSSRSSWPIWCACSIISAPKRRMVGLPWAGASRATSRPAPAAACRFVGESHEPQLRAELPPCSIPRQRRAPLLAGKTPPSSSPASSPGRSSHAALDALVDSISRLHKRVVPENARSLGDAGPRRAVRAPMPTLVVTSEHDSPLSAGVGARHGRAHPRRRAVEIPGAGHLRTSSSPSTSMQRCRLSFRNYDPQKAFPASAASACATRFSGPERGAGTRCS